MIGIIIGLLLSWGLLKWLTNGGVKQLFEGGWLRSTRLLFTGVAFGLLVSTIAAAIRLWLVGSVLSLNPDVSSWLLLEGLSFVVKSVAYEELLFRGAIFLIVMQRFGAWPALFTSSVLFGIYHWFTMGIVGQIIPMIAIFLMTGFMGAVWAYAFVKCKNILLPIGLHIGANLVSVVILSSSALGAQLFIENQGMPLFEYAWVVTLLISLFLVQLLTLFFVKISHSRNLFSVNGDEVTR
ncbi:CPBP family intramembrane glutamic endopeptidase [Kordiimonas laminariae]|uniref:CPBP family intramembrane glutamic endopeptidase n=1 Tax=Kordiimonas laminariae TaxID=2917717 RepID=UPI001FF49013|nr:CPBP family intramembrane glutamic endopeptidase [Kordiimonas laminariae]MCK0070963.1 CPBP family intramembrane metalloprotease [Kordiimonas laminariae]